MSTKRLMKYLAVASVAALWVGHAEAATFDLNLSGDLANLDTNAANTFFGLTLTGLDPAFTLAQDDIVNLTVTLNAPLTIPTSGPNPGSFTDYEFFLRTTGDFSAGNVFTTGSETFFDGGVQSAQTGAVSETSAQLAAGGDLFPPNNGAFTFDSISQSFTVTQLSAPITALIPRIEFQVISAPPPTPGGVPEPAAWALMLVGFGGMGALLRRKRSALLGVA